MTESELKRTSISMDAILYQNAEERLKRLGYGSFSEYVQYLIQADLHARAPHTVIREEGTVTHIRGKITDADYRTGKPKRAASPPPPGHLYTFPPKPPQEQ